MVAKTPPRDHISTATVRGRPRITSGDLRVEYVSLFLKSLSSVNCHPDSERRLNTNLQTHLYATGCMVTPRFTSVTATAEPKSVSLTLKLLSFCVTVMMLCGFIPAWMTPSVFRDSSALSSCRDKKK